MFLRACLENGGNRNRNRKTEKQEKLPIYYLSTYLEIIRERSKASQEGEESKFQTCFSEYMPSRDLF